MLWWSWSWGIFRHFLSGMAMKKNNMDVAKFSANSPFLNFKPNDTNLFSVLEMWHLQQRR